ncbi:MAG: hypothetical protein ACLUD2_14660 [Clostridium sp.]
MAWQTELKAGRRVMEERKQKEHAEYGCSGMDKEIELASRAQIRAKEEYEIARISRAGNPGGAPGARPGLKKIIPGRDVRFCWQIPSG